MTDRYSEVIKGIDYIWNNKFDEADKLFETQRTKIPRYALHFAESRFLRSFLTADQEDTQSALNRFKACKDLAEEHLKFYERGQIPGAPLGTKVDINQLKQDLLETRIVIGDALYMMAVIQMLREARIKGAFNLRRSWKVFEKALKDSKEIKSIDPELQTSLEFGAGFFLFAISILPQKFLKIVELVGFKSDKDTGLHYIRTTQKHGGIRGPYATMLLLCNDLLLPRGIANVEEYLREADALITESLTKYPEGSLFHVMGSHCARKQCNLDKGIKLMEIAIDNSKNLSQPPLIYRYELANCYCMNLEFQKAADMFAPLTTVPKFQVKTIATLQLGACFIMTGEYEKAQELFQKVASSGAKGNLDSMIVRQSKRYLINGGHFAAFELLYMRRDLAKMTANMKAVLQELDKMASHTKALSITGRTPKEERKSKSKLVQLSSSFKNLSPFSKKKEDIDTSFDDRASYLLLRGSMLKSLGHHEEAVACFIEVVDVLAEDVTEKMFVPYAYYELGESYYTVGKLKEAEEMMKKCGKISGYDWEDPLRIRLRVTMDQLKKGMLPPSETSKPPISLDALAETTSSTPDVEESESDFKLDGEESTQDKSPETQHVQ